MKNLFNSIQLALLVSLIGSVAYAQKSVTAKTPAKATANAALTADPITGVLTRRLGQAVQQEQQVLSRARSAFKKGQFKTAMAEYQKIPTSSDRWPIAREEMAWTSFRMKEYQMAAAQVRSLTNDYLKTQIDLEPFLLQSIIQLYTCDYNAVFATLGETKRQMADYVTGIERMTKGTLVESQMKAIDQMMFNKTFDGLKPEAFHVLPRRFYLDKQASRAIKAADRATLMKRLKSLATIENKRNHKILQHLHLVEVEAIQRAFIPNDFGGKKLTQVPNGGDLMIFNGDEELWADEVDKTQADLYVCDSKTGRTL